jgi:hypothetical protein
MPAGGAEAERLQPFPRELSRVDLLDPDGSSPRAKFKEQLLHTRSAIVDERAARYNLGLLHAVGHVNDAACQERFLDIFAALNNSHAGAKSRRPRRAERREQVTPITRG